MHLPTGISVQCQETRDLTSNRAIARRILREKVEFAQKGANSKLGRTIEKAQKRKKNSARRAKKKYAVTSTNSETPIYEMSQEQTISRSTLEGMGAQPFGCDANTYSNHVDNNDCSNDDSSDDSSDDSGDDSSSICDESGMGK